MTNNPFSKHILQKLLATFSELNSIASISPKPLTSLILGFSSILLSSSKKKVPFLTTEFRNEWPDICLKDVIHKNQELISAGLKDKNLEFHVNYSSEVPDEFIGYKNSIFRILLNILNNAIKFTDYGSITIDVIKKRTDTS